MTTAHDNCAHTNTNTHNYLFFFKLYIWSHNFTDIALKMITYKILDINVAQQDFDRHHTLGSKENSHSHVNLPDSNIMFFTASHYFPLWSLQTVQSSLHQNINDVADAGTGTIPVYQYTIPYQTEPNSKDCSSRTAGLSFVVPASRLLVLIMPQNEYRVEKSSAGTTRQLFPEHGGRRESVFKGLDLACHLQLNQFSVMTLSLRLTNRSPIPSVRHTHTHTHRISES